MNMHLVPPAARLSSADAPEMSDPAESGDHRQLYQRSLALAKIGAWQCDLADNALTWTDGVYDLFELPRGAAIDRGWVVDFYHDECRDEMERLRAQAIACGGGFTMEARIRTVTGRERWMRLIAEVECENGRPARLFGLKQDITEERARWERMRRLAESDPLTGLANRGVFETQLQEICARTDTAAVALVLIDLDNFKQINDRFGHPAGDACLQCVAARLRGSFAGAALHARIGGDEFAVLITAPAMHHLIPAQVDRFLDAMRRSMAWRSDMLTPGASVGVAIAPAGMRSDPTTLFSEADAALYQAKAAGRGLAVTWPGGGAAGANHRRPSCPSLPLTAQLR